MPVLLNLTEAAREVGCHRMTIQRWIAECGIRPVVAGGRRCLTPDHMAVIRRRAAGSPIGARANARGNHGGRPRNSSEPR